MNTKKQARSRIPSKPPRHAMGVQIDVPLFKRVVRLATVKQTTIRSIVTQSLEAFVKANKA